MATVVVVVAEIRENRRRRLTDPQSELAALEVDRPLRGECELTVFRVTVLQSTGRRPYTDCSNISLELPRKVNVVQTAVVDDERLL